MSLLSWCHLLLRNWPCSSPRGRRSSPPIFGPAFSWSSKEEEQQVCLLPAERPRSWAGLVIQIFYLHHAVTRPLKQAAVPETEKHCLPGRINLNVLLLLLNRERERERRWALPYVQCLCGSRSSAMALWPQGHLKKRLTASCQRSSWFCSTQRSAGLK